MKIIAIVFLAILVAGCAKTTALLSGGRIIDIECPVLNPETGDVATLPNGDAAVAKYRYITGGASQSFDVSAPGCVSAQTKKAIQGENRIDSVTQPAGALLEKAGSLVPGG